MKVITEAILRDELRNTSPKVYYIPEGKLLSPAAREYLQQLKIKIEKATALVAPAPPTEGRSAPIAQLGGAKYVDFASGAFYTEKPEHMTQLFGNKLVPKDHPRIVFRGKLDSLQALVVSCEVTIAECCPPMLGDLEDILGILREIMRCDVLDQPFTRQTIIGLDHAQLRDHSHHPEKYYNIKQMLLPSYQYGRPHALLNQIRTAVRECEVTATAAYRSGNGFSREDILETFNRLSSALHIMMCKTLGGVYEKGGGMCKT